MKTAATLLLSMLALGAVARGQGNLTPADSPAPTMKTLQQVYDQISTLTTLSPTQRFSSYAFVASPSAAGGKECTSIPIAAGSVVKLDSITGATYSDASSLAYLRYLVREGPSTSRILTYRLPLQTALADPVANTRSVHAPFVVWVSGGNVFDVNNGEIHTLSVCVQSSSGASATGAFQLTGSYIAAAGAAAPAGQADSAAEAKKESSRESGTLRDDKAEP